MEKPPNAGNRERRARATRCRTCARAVHNAPTTWLARKWGGLPWFLLWKTSMMKMAQGLPMLQTRHIAARLLSFVPVSPDSRPTLTLEGSGVWRSHSLRDRSSPTPNSEAARVHIFQIARIREPGQRAYRFKAIQAVGRYQSWPSVHTLLKPSTVLLKAVVVGPEVAALGRYSLDKEPGRPA